jgi:hypothetical protein
MVQLEPEKAGSLPTVWVYVSRAKATDPSPDHIQVASSELVLDGAVVPKLGLFYSGPNGPLPVGGTYRYPIGWDVTPDLTKPHTVAVRVKNQPYGLEMVGVKNDNSIQESKAEPLQTGTPLADAWDKATPGLAPPPEVKPVLYGSITDDPAVPVRNGETRTFVATLFNKEVACQEWSLKNEFDFRNLPAGTYTLTCTPRGQKLPSITAEGTPPELQLSFAPAFEIGGRLKYPDGSSMAYVQVTGKWVSDDGTMTYTNSVETDDGGAYRLRSPFAKFVSYSYIYQDKEVRVEESRTGAKVNAAAPAPNK